MTTDGKAARMTAEQHEKRYRLWRQREDKDRANRLAAVASRLTAAEVEDAKTAA